MAGWAEQLEALDEAGVQVIALTAEPEDEAARILEKLDRAEEGLGFPIAWGLDVDEIQETVGSYVNREKDPPHLHATGVILDPEGRVKTVVYSSGAIGRLEPGPTLGMVKHWEG